MQPNQTISTLPDGSVAIATTVTTTQYTSLADLQKQATDLQAQIDNQNSSIAAANALIAKLQPELDAVNAQVTAITTSPLYIQSQPSPNQPVV